VVAEAEAAQDRTAAKAQFRRFTSTFSFRIQNEREPAEFQRAFLLVRAEFHEGALKYATVVQCDIGYAHGLATTVPGPTGLICINCRGFPVCVYSEKPILGSKGIGAMFIHVRPPFPRFINCSSHSHASRVRRERSKVV
jgi:hypothetical protein